MSGRLVSDRDGKLGQLIACRNQGKGRAFSDMAFMSGGIGSFVRIASFPSVINSNLSTSKFLCCDVFAYGHKDVK